MDSKVNICFLCEEYRYETALDMEFIYRNFNTHWLHINWKDHQISSDLYKKDYFFNLIIYIL